MAGHLPPTPGLSLCSRVLLRSEVSGESWEGSVHSLATPSGPPWRAAAKPLSSASTFEAFPCCLPQCPPPQPAAGSLLAAHPLLPPRRGVHLDQPPAPQSSPPSQLPFSHLHPPTPSLDLRNPAGGVGPFLCLVPPEGPPAPCRLRALGDLHVRPLCASSSQLRQKAGTELATGASRVSWPACRCHGDPGRGHCSLLCS